MATNAESRPAGPRTVLVPLLGLLLAALLAAAAFPGRASAHGGASAPNATSYLARVTRSPAGVQTAVVDGDLRMWLRAAPGETVVVRDYGGAPYLRFSRSGVAVNERSPMFYLNLSPPLRPPGNLRANAPPKWWTVSRSHEYTWNDGRLEALSAVALSPAASVGETYVGRWIVPIVVDGRATVVTGGLWHRANPSIAWFWPIVVLFACVLAAWRLRWPALEERIARVLAIGALAALAAGACGRQLYGRPFVSAWQLAALAVVLALVALALARTVLGRAGYFTYLLVAIAAIGGDFELIPTLLHGYVLMAEPAFLARTAAVLCAGCGAGLLVLAIRIGEAPDRAALAD